MNAQDKAASAIRRCNRLVFGTETPSVEQWALAEANVEAAFASMRAEEKQAALEVAQAALAKARRIVGGARQ